ncbi:unnamed protein product, partial [Closterium sp. Naga37s-1]
TPYVDVCADVAFAGNARSLHGATVAAGVPAITTAGIYPGVINCPYGGWGRGGKLGARWDQEQRAMLCFPVLILVAVMAAELVRLAGEEGARMVEQQASRISRRARGGGSHHSDHEPAAAGRACHGLQGRVEGVMGVKGGMRWGEGEVNGGEIEEGGGMGGVDVGSEVCGGERVGWNEGIRGFLTFSSFPAAAASPCSPLSSRCGASLAPCPPPLPSPPFLSVPGQRLQLPAYSRQHLVDFGPGVGERTTYLLNLPEVVSAHEVLGVPTVWARFGTAPHMWNWGMHLLQALLPQAEAIPVGQREKLLQRATLGARFVAIN